MLSSLAVAVTDQSALTPPPLSPPADFHLYWTVGFSGKRFPGPASEEAIRAAIRAALDFLGAQADAHGARLTAVSSLARGGDLLFAEGVASRSTRDAGRRLPWKCLLPFSWEAFIARDLAADQYGAPLDEADRCARRVRTDAIRGESIGPAVVTSPGANPDDDLQRNAAYLECGYRIVDDSDVMIVLLRGAECERLAVEMHRRGPGGGARNAKETLRTAAGTYPVASYAVAAGRPVIVLDADAPNVWNPERVLNAPSQASADSRWFFDPLVSAALHEALREKPGVSDSLRSCSAGSSGARPQSVRPALLRLRDALSAQANRYQRRTFSRLRRVLLFHLAASTMAALGATVLLVDPHLVVAVIWLFALAALALVKPALAFAAFVQERLLHRGGGREAWLHARILSEIIRGALATWPLPIQPAGTLDEDAFPGVRRLVRTLRLLREQDADAAAPAATRLEGETQIDADMRVACDRYIVERLLDQATYYGNTRKKFRGIERRWRTGFLMATWTAIALGVVVALDRVMRTWGGHLLGDLAERALEAAIIIAPFVAAFCLGMMTVLDTRRRCRRYRELEDELRRLADMLGRTVANPSRIRLIEHAERILLEEQHEWFSVMRNVSV